MKRSRFLGRLAATLPVATLLFLLLLLLLLYPTARSEARRTGLEAAWERAREAGSYRFSADVVQTTVPLATVTNVGRQSREDALHLEGRTNLPERALELTAWSQGGTVLDARSGFEVRVEGDRALARQGVGPWEEINDFTGLFAPNSDFMAYLAAVKDVVEAGAQTRAGITFTRYTFAIDGPRFATYMRDQIERQLAEEGELPPGVELGLPRRLAEMTGDGELWVGQDGLPLRQILHLAFPERGDQRVEADIEVAFSDFGAGGMDLSSEGLAASQRLLQQLILFATGLAFVAVLVVFRRARSLYVSLVLVLIFSMVVTPLLQSAQAAAFARRQEDRSVEQEQRAQESDMLRALRRVGESQDSVAPSGPAALAVIQSDNGRDRDRDGLTDVQELFLGTSPLWADADSVERARSSATPLQQGGVEDMLEETGVDSDSDGLTDYQEALLGTDPDFADTDDDGITDTTEMEGFAYAGRTWYTDPLENDTNSDGVDDGREWSLDVDGDGLPDDTDGDGVPDLLDRDNDADGVPDNLDLSPYQTTLSGTVTLSQTLVYAQDSVYGADNPFSLIVDGLTPGEPTYVEFQLRPVDFDHLWYAYNVLDWPEGDTYGQVQDTDGATFYDQCEQEALAEGKDPADECTLSPGDNGDVKLVPMLEILITAPPTVTLDAWRDNLPPTSTLKNMYGISVVPHQTDNSEKSVYVPLQLISDDGARVAFQGKMLYMPTDSWGTAQQVRLVWVVQALVDVCSDSAEGGECVGYETLNDPQVIHTYYEDWFLTGLTVREDHGVMLDIVYEDPDSDLDPDDDWPLLALAYGLDHTFLSGRDEDGDGQLDITVADIKERFDITSTVPMTDRWQIDANLHVEMFSYEHQDEAMRTVATTETKRILEDTFTPHWSSSVPITPTILFVREERYRALGLDGGEEEGPLLTWDGSQLTIDMAPLEEKVDAGLNWGPYAYDGDVLAWYALPIEDYWEELVRRYADDADDPDPYVAAGQMFSVQILYLTLYRGVSQIVQSGTTILTRDFQTSDKPLGFQILSAVRSFSKFALTRYFLGTSAGYQILGIVLEHYGWFSRRGLTQPFQLTRRLAVSGLKAIARQIRNWYRMGKMRSIGSAGLAALAIIGLIVVGVYFLIKEYFAGNRGVKIAVAVVVGIVMAAFTIVAPLLQVVDYIKALRVMHGLSRGAATMRALTSSSRIAQTSLKACAICLVVELVIIWGIFIYALAAGLATTKPAILTLLAQTIAATMMAILFFVLSTTVIGAIIVAIIALLDMVLLIAGADFSILGWITETYAASAIYDYYVSVEPGVDMGQFSSALVFEEMGLQTGNSMEVSAPITVTAVHTRPAHVKVSWIAILSEALLYSRDKLSSTDVRADLDVISTTVSASRGRMSEDWTVTKVGRWFNANLYRGEYTYYDSAYARLTEGMNVPVSLYLNVGYALPAVECILSVCTDDTLTDSTSEDLGTVMVLDVFPRTLSEFCALTWSDSSEFAVQMDQDGDGLINRALNGNDPNDTDWDSDDDGLSDAWEMEMRALGLDEGGAAYNPADDDSDDDGLCDRQEMLAGTDPVRSDSDGDGLLDGFEVFHQDLCDRDNDGNEDEWFGGWTFDYNYVYTDTYGIPQSMSVSAFVTSNPLMPDEDIDGLDDKAEWAIGAPYHPSVWNRSPLAVYPEVDDADGFVHRGQTFVYTATVRSEIITPLWALGQLTATIPYRLGGGQWGGAFNIFQNESEPLTTPLTVRADAAGGRVVIENTYLARLHNGDISTKWTWDPPEAAPEGTASDYAWHSAIVPITTSVRDPATVLYDFALASAEGNGQAIWVPPSAYWDAPEAYYLDGEARARLVADGYTNVTQVSTDPPTPANHDASHVPPLVNTSVDVACANGGDCLTVWGDARWRYCGRYILDSVTCYNEDDWGSHGEYELWYFPNYVYDCVPSMPELCVRDLDAAVVLVEEVSLEQYETVNLGQSYRWCENGTSDDLPPLLWMHENDTNNMVNAMGSQRPPADQLNPIVWRSSYRFAEGRSLPFIFNFNSEDDVGLNLTIYPEVQSNVFGTLVHGDGDLGPTQRRVSSLFTESDQYIYVREPVVASDGNDFVVVWREEGASTGLRANRVFRSDAIVDHGGWAQSVTGTGLRDKHPALAYVGDNRYLLVWQHLATTGIHDIWMRYLNERGEPLGSNATVAASWRHEMYPRVAYDPETDSALIVYTWEWGVRGRLVQGTALQPEIVIADESDRVFGPAAVAYEPTYGGWLVAWVVTPDPGADSFVRYALLDTNGTVLATETFTPTNVSYEGSIDVACVNTTEPDGNRPRGKCGVVTGPEPGAQQQIDLTRVYPVRVLPWLGEVRPPAPITLPVTIDTDLPTVQFTSISDSEHLNANGVLNISGSAADATSGIARVEISLDGGSTWVEADERANAETWAYGWDLRPLAESWVTLRARAVDLADNVGPEASVTVYLDRTAPDPQAGFTSDAIFGATRDTGTGHWQVSLYGTVSERPTGGGSGIHSVETRVDPNGGTWQAAALAGGDWSVAYTLASFDRSNIALVNPTGFYTLSLRATDGVSNTTAEVDYPTISFGIDSTPPVADVGNTGPSTDVITSALTVGGVVTDVGSVAAGVQSLQIAFTPAGQLPGSWEVATLSPPGGEGRVSTNWSHPVPEGLEGTYWINLRGTDTRNNRNDLSETWPRWQGHIDTLAPRGAVTMTYRGGGSAAQTVYEGWAEDSALSLQGFDFACWPRAADRHYDESSSYSYLLPARERLVRLTPQCVVNGLQTTTATLQACDRYGHCGVAEASPPAYVPSPLASAVLTPGHESVVTTVNPISVTVGAHALDALRALTLTVSDGSSYTVTWACEPVTDTITDTLWATTWDPPGQGRYGLQSAVEDCTGQAQAESQPVTVTVDALGPSISIARTVFTTAHRIAYALVPITGTVSDTMGLEAVEVLSSTWDEASFGDGTWRYVWDLGVSPDAVDYTITARATDAAGHTGQDSQTLTVDLVPPAPVTPTLSYQVGATTYPLQAGETVRAAAPTLILEWTESSDGSGSVTYWAGWTTDPEPDPAALTQTAVRHFERAVSEPQEFYAHLVLEDAHGNRHVQTEGPVYVDGAYTPDFVSDLGYHGWMESGCSQIGADREVARNAHTGASLDQIQRFYATWDSDALRFTWTGANWDAEGDLFIYLDTGAGGTTTAYDPYGAGPVIHLPAQDGSQLYASHLIWVQDADTAELLTWSAGAWLTQTLDSDHYSLDIGLDPVHTDLLIPFESLNLTTTSSLKLVALASEEDALRIWAAMPDKNPLNSRRVVSPVARDYVDLPFTLTQQYEWTALGDGSCPGGGQFADADLHVSLTADPAGVEVGYLQHDLPGLLGPGQHLDADLDGEPDVALPMDLQPVWVGDGQAITYTVTYTNAGTVLASQAQVTLTARGGVRFAGGAQTQVISLTQPVGTVSVTGTVDTALDLHSAEVDGVVADATHGAFDWLWVQHDVDTNPPVGLTIDRPLAYVTAYTSTVRGEVHDPSGVPLVELQVNPGGTVLSCPDDTPYDGDWACEWNVGDAADGTQLQLCARATDRFGNQTAGWTPCRNLIVDRTPPTVTLSVETQAAFADGLLVRSEMGLTGEVQDDRQASEVAVCVAPPGEPDQARCRSEGVVPGTTATGSWRVLPPIDGTEDGDRRTFTFYGLDGAGNRSAPEARTVPVDVVAPVVTITTWLSNTVLGIPETTVLAGSVSDGSGVEQVVLHKAWPDGSGVLITPTLVGGSSWSYATTFTTTGRHALGVQAWDVAGNLRQRGPYYVNVYTGTLVANMSITQSASSDPAVTGRLLTYTVVAHNSGPSEAVGVVITDVLPAPTSLYDITPDQGSCGTESGGVVTCTLGTVGVGADAGVTVRVYVPLATTGKLTNTVRVGSEKIDFFETDNERALYVDTFQPVTGLTVSSSGPTPLGDPTVFSATVATGTDVAYTWSFGDGLTGTGQLVDHTYAAVGRYTAVVTASNWVNALSDAITIPVDIPIARPHVYEEFSAGFPPDGWQAVVVEGSTDDVGWRRNTTIFHSSPQSSFHSDRSGWYDSWLVTPQFTPTLSSELVLWQYAKYEHAYHKRGIWVSTGKGDPRYDEFVPLEEAGPGPESVWDEFSVDLGAYLGQPIYLAFRYEGDYADEWYVDDVRVTAPLVARNDGPTPLGQMTTLTASVGTGTNVTFTWDLGDGNTGSGAVVTNTYGAPGSYTAVVTASNSVSVVTATTTVYVGVFTYLPLVLRDYGVPCSDAYEPDDVVAEARPIATDGTAQLHSFHRPGDKDWVSFEVLDADVDYVIETLDLAGGADTVIYLFDSDGQLLLDWNDDAHPWTRVSRLYFDPYHAGMFYVRIDAYDPQLAGCDVTYSVRVVVQVGAGVYDSRIR